MEIMFNRIIRLIRIQKAFITRILQYFLPTTKRRIEMRVVQTSMYRVLLAILLLFYTQFAYAVPHYVSPTGNDANDGLTWGTAKATIQPAINDASSGDEVWVAAGTYSTQGTSITAKTGVSMYGGFNGTETLRDQRNSITNISLIDGIDTNHNILQLPSNSVMTIDGFSIKNGFIGILLYSGAAPIISNNIITNNIDHNSSGGGIQGDSGSPIITGNTISNNTAYLSGGGIFYVAGSPTITNNTITNNTTLHGSGGGIWVGNQCSSIIIGNTISANTANTYGGGIDCEPYYTSTTTIISNNVLQGNITQFYDVGAIRYSAYNTWNNTLTLSDNLIQNNISARDIGGVFIHGSRTLQFNRNRLLQNTAGGIAGGVNIDSVNTFSASDNLIAGNSTTSQGGGIYIDASSGKFTNNTIAYNNSPHNGSAGGLFFDQSTVSFANNIVAFNTSGVLDDGSNTLTLTTNDVFGNTDYNYSGLAPGFGDLTTDPAFVDALHGDYHLASNSPALETGTDSFVALADTDLDGNPRIFGTHVDIGAYEWSPTYPDITGLSLSASSVPGGQTLTGTVTLAAPALTNGAVVSLLYNAGTYGIVSGPNTVTVLQGNTSANFTINTNSVAHNTPATVTAKYRGINQTANFTVTLYLASLTLAKSEIPSGGSTTGNVHLNGPAPVGGLVINLASANPGIATVPATVNVPAGSTTSNNFTINAGVVTFGKSVVITASYGVQSVGATILVDPAGVDVKKVTLVPASLVGGQTGYGVVTLTAKAPAGGLLVPLSSANPSVVSVPAYVAIAQGRSSASFPVGTSSVLATTSVVVSASMTTTKTATLSVKANAILSVVLAPSPANVGDTIIGVVTLIVPAAAGGVTITFTTTTPTMISPDASIFIPAGQTTGVFYAEATASGAAKVVSHLGAVATTSSITISP